MIARSGLYVASIGRPLPLSLIYDVKGIRSQVTFSNWGEAVRLAPPANSIPASSLSAPLQAMNSSDQESGPPPRPDLSHRALQRTGLEPEPAHQHPAVGWGLT